MNPTEPRAAEPHRFYALAWLAAAIVVVAGFAPSYFLRPFVALRPLPLLVHAHGALMTAWFALFAIQVSLVARQRVHLHRRLGIIGALLAALIVIIGVTTAVAAQRLGHRPPGASLEDSLYAGVVPLLVFGGLIGTALGLKRHRGAHARLMLLATLTLVQAAAGRLPLDRWPLPALLRDGGPFGLLGIELLLIYACVGWDTWRGRRLHPAFALGLLVMLAIEHLLADPLAASAAWHTLAHRLVP